MSLPFELLFPLFLGAMWPVTFYVLAQVSGWAQLAEKYRCDDDSSVDSWKGWAWGKFGAIAYKQCLWVGVGPKGLYLKTGPLFFFGAFHPPLLIPWSKIRSVEESKYWWLRVMKIKLTDLDVEIMLEQRVLEDGQRFLGDKLIRSQ